MRRENRRGYISILLFAILILVLSIIPTDKGGTPSFYFEGMDKIIHALMYGIFTMLILNQYVHQQRIKFLWTMVLLMGIWAYSVLMEILQLALVESRSYEFNDILANLAGIVAASLLFFLFRKIRS
jgi:VanZ family protein